MSLYIIDPLSSIVINAIPVPDEVNVDASPGVSMGGSDGISDFHFTAAGSEAPTVVK